MLLANILKCKREELIINSEKEVEEKEKNEFTNGIYKIAKRYPVEYILGKKEFMKMTFFVNEDVLIPRADTEILVEEVLELSKDKDKVLELCTGSGVIAISLAKYGEGLSITATDISEKALEVAKENAKNLLENSQIKFIKSDMFENINGKFDIIVSNPPYIKRDVIKEYLLEYEPHLALDGGEDGLDFYKTIVDNAYKYLNPNGIIALEIGYDQREEVVDLIEKSKKYKDVYCKKDLFGNSRVIVCKRK